MELNRLIEFLQGVYRKADVRAVFGEPRTVGDRTLIPTARVVYCLALGFGQGESPDPAGAEAQTTDPRGGGGGAGCCHSDRDGGGHRRRNQGDSHCGFDDAGHRRCSHDSLEHLLDS